MNQIPREHATQERDLPHQFDGPDAASCELCQGLADDPRHVEYERQLAERAHQAATFAWREIGS